MVHLKAHGPRKGVQKGTTSPVLPNLSRAYQPYSLISLLKMGIKFRPLLLVLGCLGSRALMIDVQAIDIQPQASNGDLTQKPPERFALRRRAEGLVSLSRFPQDVRDLPIEQTADAYARSQFRQLYLDYDGTMVGLVPDPSKALPTPALLKALGVLHQTPQTQVHVISGRTREFLDDVFSEFPQFILVAEHGAFRKLPYQPWQSSQTKAESNWKVDMEELMNEFVKQVPGSFVEKKKAGLVWHYRKATTQSPDLKKNKDLLNTLVKGFFQQLSNEAKSLELKATWGDCILEVTDPRHNKGAAVKWFLENSKAPDYILCLGDDRTDEDMFRALSSSTVGKAENIWTAVVAMKKERETVAKFKIANEYAVINLLLQLGIKDKAHNAAEAS